MDDQVVDKQAAKAEATLGISKKGKSKKAAKKMNKKAVPAVSSGKGKQWTFPKNNLEDAIKVAKALEDKFAGNPTPALEVASAVGFKRAEDWRFLDLLRSANLYGLVTGTGSASVVALTPLGQDIVAPSSPSQRVSALHRAFKSVKEFEQVETYYKGKKLPEDEFFFNTLTREIAIPKDRVDVFARVFQENLRFLQAFTPREQDLPVVRETTTSPVEDPHPVIGGVPQRGREFLDTCFVMMPFGEWPDLYYQDIYVPAIKEAGLEPSRADELFHTGSVVEQIWEQIEKSRLLLADLSGRNANVFYELGLAHAAKKPVVFTASSVEDVPFDLRHLRVIIYDIRRPDWASRLRIYITDYLRNAMKEPEKSIPHPWKRMKDEERD